MCCTHFTAVIHSTFQLHNRSFCLPVTLSSVHNFIWMKDGKHSYMSSVTSLHRHKRISALWLLHLLKVRQRWHVLSVTAYCTHRNCSLVCEGTEMKQIPQDILITPSTLYKQTDFLQSSCMSRACVLWSWNTEMCIHDSRLAAHTQTGHASTTVVPKWLSAVVLLLTRVPVDVKCKGKVSCRFS
jgi:hypothetical protein